MWTCLSGVSAALDPKEIPASPPTHLYLLEQCHIF